MAMWIKLKRAAFDGLEKHIFLFFQVNQNLIVRYVCIHAENKASQQNTLQGYFSVHKTENKNCIKYRSYGRFIFPLPFNFTMTASSNQD